LVAQVTLSLCAKVTTVEQLERAGRYLERIRAVYAGIFSTHHDKDGYEDDVISFFVHCYHIRDWIIHLNRVGVTAVDLDAFINKHEALRICADLCNGSKHCKLTRTLRTEKQPHISGKEYRSSTWYSGSGGGEVIKGRYSILTSSGRIDALELAEACMGLWSQYVSEIEAAHNHTLQPTRADDGAVG
jgi:hypothetical protein